MALPTQVAANKSCDVLIGHADTDELIYFNLGGVRLYVGTGTPHATVTAPKGSLFIETGTPKLYQNTDASTTWAAVGGQS